MLLGSLQYICPRKCGGHDGESLVEIVVRVPDAKVVCGDGAEQGARYQLCAPLDQDLVIEGDSFRLPWKRLAYWVQGLQGPGMTPIEGLFLQDGWSVSILDADHSGPVLIVLSHPEVRLRLKVYQWQRGTVKGPAKQI